MKDTPRLNGYRCQQCVQIIWTKDEDQGVTPFMIECRKCGGVMYSSFYSVPDWVTEFHVSAVWRKSFPPEYTKEEREICEEHAGKGGLFLHYLDEQVAMNHGKPKNADYRHLSRSERKKFGLPAPTVADPDSRGEVGK